MEGEDDQLLRKAYSTLTMWAFKGLSVLKEESLLEQLKPENKHLPMYNQAIGILKLLLQIEQ